MKPITEQLNEIKSTFKPISTFSFDTGIKDAIEGIPNNFLGDGFMNSWVKSCPNTGQPAFANSVNSAKVFFCNASLSNF